MKMFGLSVVTLLVPVCIATALYAAEGQHQGRRTAPAARSASSAVVKMTGDQLTFNPPTIVIRRGQTVEWQNQSNQLHDVVDDATKATNKADVQLPKGAAAFGSQYLKPGENFSHRFTVRGTYRYVCTLHEVQGMKGEVVVK